MLSVFPQLFAYQLLSLSLLRVVLSFVLIGRGYKKLIKKQEQELPLWKKIAACAELVSAVLLFFGFLTQPAVIAISLTAILDGKKTLNLLIVAGSLVLLFSGPGVFSIDISL